MPFEFNPRYVIFGFGGLIILALLFALFSGGSEGGQTFSAEVNVWGYIPENRLLKTINEFSQGGSGLKVTYKGIPEENYETTLLNALAAGQGPDVFMLKSSSKLEHWKKFSPAPDGLFTPNELLNAFPDVVLGDFYIDGKLYGLPATFSPLTLFYNKDYFNAAGVALPPKTWDELQMVSQKLTLKKGNFLSRGGVALGAADNITHFKDILAAQILQKSGQRDFFSVIGDKDAAGVFRYYLNFSDPRSPYYSWNSTFENDIEAFASGKVGIVFGYPSDYGRIFNLNPRLNLGLAPLPQYDLVQPVNFADYSVFVVSNLSKNPVGGWQAVKFITNNRTSLSMANDINEPPVFREYISKVTDPVLNIFASEILTAKSWPDPGPKDSDRVFSNAINDYLTGRKDLNKVMSELQTALYQLQTQLNSKR